MTINYSSRSKGVSDGTLLAPVLFEYLKGYYTNRPYRLSSFTVSLNGANADQVDKHLKVTSDLLVKIRDIPNTG